MVIAELECIVVDCPHPDRLATFYQTILGGAIDQPDPRWSLDDGWATLHTPSGPVLAFQRVADHRPPRWPDPARPQQFHLDFGVPDLDSAQEKVLALGATVLDGGAENRSWRVYADPAGHPFCLIGQRRPVDQRAPGRSTP